MYMASLTGAEMASRLPVISAEAMAPLSPGSTRADARVDAVAQALDRGGVSQPQPGRRRRLGRLDRAEHEAGRADALEIKIAGEVVAAGPQRLERRGQPRAERHIGADRRRRALLHRDADAVGLLLQAACLRTTARGRRCGRCARAPRGPRRSPRWRRCRPAAPGPDARSGRSSASPRQSPRRRPCRRARWGNAIGRRRATNGDARSSTAQTRARPPGAARGRQRNRSRCRGRTRPAATAAAARDRCRRSPSCGDARRWRGRNPEAAGPRQRAPAPRRGVPCSDPATAAAFGPCPNPPCATPPRALPAKRDPAGIALRGQLLPPTSLANVSRNPTVRLNTGRSGVESGSRTK